MTQSNIEFKTQTLMVLKFTIIFLDPSVIKRNVSRKLRGLNRTYFFEDKITAKSTRRS